MMAHVGEPERSAREATPEVPEGLDAVCAKLMARDPEDRNQDASVHIEDLERVKEGLSPAAAVERARVSRRPRNQPRGSHLSTAHPREREYGRLLRFSAFLASALVLVGVGVVTAVIFFGQSGTTNGGQQAPVAQGSDDSDVPLFRVSGLGTDFSVTQVAKQRVIVLNDVSGETVIIVIEAVSSENFDKFLPIADMVLKSTQWMGV